MLIKGDKKYKVINISKFEENLSMKQTKQYYIYLNNN